MFHVDVGRVPEGAVYESNMSIESCIESNRVGLPTTPIPDWFFGTFDRGRFIRKVFALRCSIASLCYDVLLNTDLLFLNFALHCCSLAMDIDNFAYGEAVLMTRRLREYVLLLKFKFCYYSALSLKLGSRQYLKP